MKVNNLACITVLIVSTALGISVRLSAQEQSDDPGNGYQGTLIEFDAPGATKVFSSACGIYCGTTPLANNNFGVIVGGYTDKNVVPHGFLRSPDGHIISFDAPGAGLGKGLDQGTYAYSINDLGWIAGELQDSSFVYHGFVRLPDGSINVFDAPDAGTASSTACAPYCGTYGVDINLQGTTAGFYVDGSNTYHGFVRSRRGEITSFDPPGSVYTFVCEETCLNSDGAITGSYQDANGVYHGFIRESDGTFTTVDAPGAASYTQSASINAEGVITGYFFGSDSEYHSFVRTRDGEFTTFNVPDSPGPGTAAFSINALGAVSGEFLDTSSAMHGFSRSPDGTFITFDAPGAGTSSGQGTRPSTNNLPGAIAGWWVDGKNVDHGFVWLPGDACSQSQGNTGHAQ